MHILLAEDNTVNQKVALRMLERMGFSADLAKNGIEVLEALERSTYDVILMDMQMPDMDGLEATRRIVATYPEGQRPYIIALTANAMQGDRERCIEAGMDDYISKPIRLEDLQQAFERVPERPVAESAATPPAPSSIDVNILQELIAMLGNDVEFAGGLIRDFLEDGAELVGNIRSAFDAGDAHELERAAHTLKSSSATFGAMETSRLCKVLEEHGHRGEMTDVVEQQIERLERCFEADRKELEQYVTRQMA